MALAAISVVGLAGFAGADPSDGAASGSDGGRPGRPALTDDQKACLQAHGVTPPVRPADGSRPAPPSDEQRAALQAAAEACGLPAMGPPTGRFGPRPQLTDDQKACLQAHGVTPPVRAADGSRPAPPSVEQRAALQAAAEACGLPAPPGHGEGDGTNAQTTGLRVSV
jgi:hypothetical protein